MHSFRLGLVTKIAIIISLAFLSLGTYYIMEINNLIAESHYVLVLDERTLAHLRAGVVFHIVFHMVVIGFVTILLLHTLLKHTMRPLKEIIRATSTVDDNNWGGFNLNAPSDLAEVNQLVESFNKMADKVRKANHEGDILCKRRKELIAKVLTLQEAEMHRISRELHDQAGQYLTAINLELHAMDNSISLDEVKERSHNIRRMVNETFKFIKNMVWKLRPSSLDDLGLPAAINTHIVNPLKKVNVNVDLQMYGIADVTLPSQTLINVYRIIQEAVSNAINHGKANSISIILSKLDGNFSVVIEDDGRGFEVEEAKDKALTNRKFGLLGMDERAAMIGGKVSIESSPGSGTTVYVKIPMQEKGVQNG